MLRILISLALLVNFPGVLSGQEQPTATHTEVIYGRKDGMALTMLVLNPEGKSVSRGIILVVSGGWGSGYTMALRFSGGVKLYLVRGYTVFAVMHSAQPKYTVPEIIPDVHRAVRFIRYHARDYGIDPNHIGITGHSAGGHLALMVAMAEDHLDVQAQDPVDRVSSRVQAAACFFPATDFLNWGKSGENKVVDMPFLVSIGAAASFDFKEWNTATKTFQTIDDSSRRTEIGRAISPLYHVTADDPPIVLAHGDADQASPLQQSERFIRELESAKVPHALHVKKGGGHGWQGMDAETRLFADWFDTYLK